MSSLTLTTSSTPFVVCRLPADASVPSWATDSQEFFSITRTTEEISIVVPVDCLPDNLPDNMKMENDWKMIKVVGPLDFSLTGIMTMLATPLGEAGISILALATYDTDYLLVRSENLFRAIQVLTEAGHVFHTSTTPRDGPATVFQLEPYLKHIIETDKTHDPTFSLVLVAGWPSSEPLRKHYRYFRTQLEACFADADLQGVDSPVYVYDASILHVTVASFHSIYQSVPSSELQTVCSKYAQQVVEDATKLATWPRSKMQLTIDRGQLGAKAGILLWKEATGGMEAVRDCIREAAASVVASLDEDASLTDEARGAVVTMLRDIAVPGIIHSSFLRFWKQPKTPGEDVQEKLQATVFPRLEEIFPDAYSVTDLRLVIEKTPCMHIPNDSDHVLYTVKLSE